MNFFQSIHRSIFEPPFYKEIIDAKRGFAVGFLIKQIIFVALISAGAQLFYLVDAKRGIIDDVAYLLSDIEIKNGTLYTTREIPYVFPADITAKVIDKLSGVSSSNGKVADSIVIVDTNSVINYSLKPLVFLLKSDKVELCFNSSMRFAIPYSSIFSQGESIVFTKKYIDKYIKIRSPVIFLQFFVSKLFENAIFLCFSALFLALTAYFFRVDKSRSLKQHLKISFFAITPITVGNILSSIADVHVSWMWNVLIFISTIVMFRAMIATGTSSQNTSGDLE